MKNLIFIRIYDWKFSLHLIIDIAPLFFVFFLMLYLDFLDFGVFVRVY
jgi:hypothetical protein